MDEKKKPDFALRNPPLPHELWLKRLTYRSWHRGCKETDIVLGTYCDQAIAGLSVPELQLYEEFLDEDDADIWNWLTHKAPCPRPEYEALLGKLRAIEFHAA
jgi:antitoxin CptB